MVVRCSTGGMQENKQIKKNGICKICMCSYSRSGLLFKKRKKNLIFLRFLLEILAIKEYNIIGTNLAFLPLSWKFRYIIVCGLPF